MIVLNRNKLSHKNHTNLILRVSNDCPKPEQVIPQKPYQSLKPEQVIPQKPYQSYSPSFKWLS